MGLTQGVVASILKHSRSTKSLIRMNRANLRLTHCKKLWRLRGGGTRGDIDVFTHRYAYFVDWSAGGLSHCGGEPEFVRRAAQPSIVEGAAGFSAADLGDDHGCVIRGDGKIYCWGSNGSGQLGLGSATPSTQATLKLASVTASFVYPISVAAGGNHSCAVDINGVAQCWGDGHFGQLGNGGTSDALSPVVFQIPSGRRARQISAGFHFTCALLDDTTVVCAGDNGRGQLGDGTTTNSSTPVAVKVTSASNLDQVVEITTGDFHACARVASGHVYCWGSALANASSGDLSFATGTPGSGFRSISASGGTSCGVTAAGAVSCWGDNSFGQLGDGTTTSRSTPATVSGVTQTVSVGVGVFHVCASDAGGALRCWGNNNNGQVGNGSTSSTPVTAPATVGFGSNAVLGVLGGLSHTCALSAEGLHCWGADGQGQLGNGTTLTADQTAPSLALLPPFVDSVQIAPFTFANVETASTFQRGRILDVGLNHSCMVVPAGSFVNVAGSATSDGPSASRVGTTGVACWGQNSFGQLGTGTNTTQTRPRFVTGLPAGPKAVATGANHSCALFANGTVRCWGANTYGQLGDGTTTHRSTPVEVAGLSNVIAITAGDEHTCALLADGKMRCWGRQDDFRLGRGEFLTGGVSPTGAQSSPLTVRRCSCGCDCDDGGTSHSNWESQLADADQFVAISAGGAYTCALRVDGTGWCWGRNTRGQAGRPGRVGGELLPLDYDVVRFAKSVELEGAAVALTSISAGDAHTCSMSVWSSVLCWGDNTSYQTYPSAPTTAQECRGSGQNAFCRAMSNDARIWKPHAVAAGGDTSCVLTNTESSFSVARCWGANGDAQAGAPETSSNVVSPQSIGRNFIPFDDTTFSILPDRFTRVVPSTRRSCALEWTGEVRCWGLSSESHGELGRGTLSSSEISDRSSELVVDLQ